jgi:urease accessory protein
MMRASKWIASAALVLVLAPAASAHPGHGAETLLSGFGHPFGGLDHLAVMIGIGAVALARTHGRLCRATLTLPGVFAASMALGLMGAGFAPGLAAAAEIGILASLGVVAVLLVAGARAPLALAVGLVGASGLAHGAAHAFDAAGAASGPFMLGVLAATLCLHAIGLLLGAALFRRAPARA